jgi:hypothetical protein
MGATPDIVQESARQTLFGLVNNALGQISLK